jgi:hypothetical protein
VPKTTAAIGLLSAAFVIYQLNAAQSAKATAKMHEAIGELGRISDDGDLLAGFFQALVNGGFAGKSFNDVLMEIGRSSPATITRLLEMEEATGAVSAGFDDVPDGFVFDELSGAVSQLKDEIAQSAVTQAENAKFTAAATGEIETQTKQVNVARRAGEDYVAQLERAGDEVARNREEHERATEAITAMRDATMRSFSTQLAYEGAVRDVESGLADLSAMSVTSVEDAESYDAAVLDLKESMLGQADAAVRLAESQAEASGRTFDAEAKTRKYRDELMRMASTLEPGSPLRSALDEWIRALNRVPASVSTSVSFGAPGGRKFVASHTGSRFQAGETKSVLPGQHFVADGPVFTAPAPGRMMSLAQSGAGAGAGGQGVTVNIGSVLGVPSSDLVRQIMAEAEFQARGFAA